MSNRVLSIAAKGSALLCAASISGSCFSPNLSQASVDSSGGSTGATHTTSTGASAAGPVTSMDDTTVTVSDISSGAAERTSNVASDSTAGSGETESDIPCTAAVCERGGCSPDLANDIEHCGACGFACPSGGCQGGFCDPVSLGFVAQPRDIAVSGTTVFVSHADGVSAFAEDGVEVPIFADDSARELVASADLVHVLLAQSEGDQAMEMAHDGSAAIDVFVPPPDLALSPGGLLSAGERIYWTQEWQNAANDMEEHVVSVAFGGGGLRDHAVVDEDPVVLAGVVGDALYFYSWGSGDIARTGVSGDGVAEPTVVGRDPLAFVASPEGLFWVERGQPGQILVVRASLDGEDVDTVALIDDGNSSDAATSIVVASETLAWTRAGQVYMCRLSDCVPVAVGEPSLGNQARLAASEGLIAWLAENQVFQLVVPSL